MYEINKKAPDYPVLCFYKGPILHEYLNPGNNDVPQSLRYARPVHAYLASNIDVVHAVYQAHARNRVIRATQARQRYEFAFLIRSHAPKLRKLVVVPHMASLL